MENMVERFSICVKSEFNMKNFNFLHGTEFNFKVYDGDLNVYWYPSSVDDMLLVKFKGFRILYCGNGVVLRGSKLDENHEFPMHVYNKDVGVR